MGVLIFGLFLWWIWPAADFDVKTVDYNMLTRIQEKIWKVAHGGLLGLFLDRGMEKLVLYPQYLLYGAGEGGFDRFTLASQVNEIHCCLFLSLIHIYVLKYYNVDFLDKNMYVCVALTIVFYALWTYEMPNAQISWTIPIFIILLMSYSLDAVSYTHLDVYKRQGCT